MSPLSRPSDSGVGQQSSSSASGSSAAGLYGYVTADMQNQLTDLRLEVSHLGTELQDLRQQYDDVTRHVLNAALHVGTSSQLARDDVSKLIDKMSTLINRTALQQWHQSNAVVHTTNGTPKGSNQYTCLYLHMSKNTRRV